LYHLTRDIAEGNCEAAYSRQIAEKNNIEKYTREKNYGDQSFIKTKNDIKTMGLNTFFFSDASSAINRNIFKKLNYYDGKRFSSNEDQYIAYKLIMNGYRIKYCADSVVIHSHDFSFKSLFKRYQDTGDFYRAEPYMNSYGTNSTGVSMAMYILKRIVEEKNGKAAIEFIPNMVARFLGMKIKK
ncbi:rhamnosyltransferase, partial [Enterococcus faecium]|nr:rhamnosyltransferase [Enterococcus faecium]